jgi:hypothetical protein
MLMRKFSMQLGPDAEIAGDVTAALAAGWEVAGTHWVDPIPAPGEWYRQGDHFLRQADLYDPVAGALDIEQYWAVWQDYWDMLKGKITGAQVRKLAPNRIRDCSAFLYDYIMQRHPMPLLPYTARWFTASYSPMLGPWIGDKPSWIADYWDYRQFLDPKGRSVPYKRTDVEFSWLVDVFVPSDPINLPTGVTNCVFRQISSRMVLDPCRGVNFDMSQWMKSDDEYMKLFGIVPPPPPPPTLEQRMATAEHDIIELEQRVTALGG